ncbi:MULTISPECIES: TetR/AcrR family transcriptional regulator [unclassified Nocardiopsis]|uniref:TetR/AcrR family transcriptional regulator n=1 Tax=Nocardiopsis TaxID=2013 RepID=UPI00387A98D1
MVGGRDTAERGETYGGRSREERAAERRGRIMDAALRLFAARDYDDVTVADVCTLAKVSKRHFYEEFSDRDDLLHAVHRKQNDWLLAGLTAAAPRDPAGLDDLLRPMMRAMVEMLHEHPDRARVIYVNAPRMELRRRGLLRKDAELLGRALRRALRRPKGRAADRVRQDRVLLALVAGVTEVVIDWLQRGMTDDRDLLVDHLTAIAAALLSALEEAP